jgi:hypothetical protein
MPGHDNKDQTVGKVDMWTRAIEQYVQLGQDRRDRIDRQDRWDRTDRTGQTGQGNRDGATVAGQSGYGSWDRTNETGQPGQVNLDRTAWTACAEQRGQVRT